MYVNCNSMLTFVYLNQLYLTKYVSKQLCYTSNVLENFFAKALPFVRFASCPSATNK